MNFFAVSALINVISSSVLGTLVLFANAQSRLHRTFFLFAGAVTLWSISYFFWQLATEADSALFWSHMLMAGSIFIPPLYFHFIVCFLKKEAESQKLIILGYAQAAIFSILNWTPLFITGVSQKMYFSFWPDPGILFLPFLVVWGFYAIYPVYLLIVRMRAAEGDELNRIRYILVGTAVGYIGGETNHFLWYNIPVPPFGTISASFYIACVAVAITRYRAFNMKIIATELLTFALWFFIFLRMIFAGSLPDQLQEAALLFVTLIAGVLLIRSVDREVEQRELIEKQEKQLEVANRQQETLLHFISHEIKGYLTKGEAAFAGIVEGDFGEVAPGIKELATSALGEMRKGVATVMDILEASDLKQGTVSFKREPFDMKVTLLNVVNALRPSAYEKHLGFDVQISDGDYSLRGDPQMLSEHVFRNLIDNAIKYTPQGAVHVMLSREPGKMRFMVRDSGVGITRDDMQKLFTEGGHGKDSIKINVHSTGYGLYIAKQVVDAHHGKIWAESEGQGKGSTFIVEVPAA